MSISFSTISSIFIEFVNENFIPIIDKSSPNYLVCIEKWQEFIDNILIKISNFNSQEDLRQKVKLILNKINKKQRAQKTPQQKPQTQLPQRLSVRVTFTQTQKHKLPKQQDTTLAQKQDPKQRQQTIQFRDRKTSLDEVLSKKQRKQQAEIIMRKEERSGSLNLSNGMQSDYITEIPLVITTPDQHTQKHRNSSYVRKENEVMSFNSISDFHKSRNNLPAAVSKQPKESELPEIKMMSKKSIQDFNSTQNRPNSYSTNYIESIKKISLESRSPNEKSKLPPSQLQSPKDFVQTPVKLLEGQQMTGGSTLSNIKKKISQGSDYVGSPPLGPSDSFGKFMNSFKKLCNTFESNHHKLMREDFSNKYVNC